MLWSLFLTFFRIGALTFGGGYAMISVIENICVEKKHWITHEDLVNVTVIAESTPGPVAINCATFVGYKQKGIWGSIAATLGVVLPSFIIIWVISMFLDRFLEIAWVASAFRGIRVAVGLLILDVGIRMAKKMPKEPIRIILMIAALALMILINLFSWNISTIVLLLAAAAISLAVFFAQDRKGKDGEQA
ncbi:MAG: chromate transporter [Clostridia bacterium]|nr:chromate transporter [Clostridia bacterium]